MIPKKPAPDLIRGGTGFSDKIMLKHQSIVGNQFPGRLKRRDIA
jgi:hypothetical protein